MTRKQFFAVKAAYPGFSLLLQTGCSPPFPDLAVVPCTVVLRLVPFSGFHMPATGRLSWKNAIRKSSYRSKSRSFCSKSLSCQTALSFEAADLFNTSSGKADVKSAWLTKWALHQQGYKVKLCLKTKTKQKTKTKPTNEKPTPHWHHTPITFPV